MHRDCICMELASAWSLHLHGAACLSPPLLRKVLALARPVRLPLQLALRNELDATTSLAQSLDTQYQAVAEEAARSKAQVKLLVSRVLYAWAA